MISILRKWLCVFTMSKYLAADTRVRLIAWRDAVKGVGWYPMEGSVMIAEAVAQIYTEWVVVEATTAGVRPKFLVLDLHDMSVDVQTGKMIPHIIAEFSDQDAAIMALRMVK